MEIINRYKGNKFLLNTLETNDYNYRNLWLFITCEAETGEEFTDTLNCVLADEYGKWFGSGWGASYQQTISYKTDFNFPRKEGILFLFNRECVMM